MSTTDDRATRNGELVNRVEKLRLGNQLGNTPRGTSTAWLPWMLCIILALAWAGVGIRGYKTLPASAAPTPVAAVPTDTKPNPTPTPSSTPNTPAATGTIVLEAKGNFLPARQIAVSPIDVAGRVVELNVIEGKKFNAGDVLAKIEDTSFKAQVAEASATVAAAEKRLDVAKAKLAALQPQSVRAVEITQVEEELKEAESTKARALDEVNRLNRLGGVAAAERELNQAKFDLQGAAARVSRLSAALTILKEGPRKETKDAAEAEVRSAEADITAAKARLQQAQWRLDNCIIRAPISGTVLTKKAELYNLVNPLAFAATSGSVCDLADLSDLEVELDIGERDIRKLMSGIGAVKIRADAWPDRTYDGTLDRILAVANRNGGTVGVRVKVKLPPGEEQGKYLKPQMGAVVSFMAQ